ncbi:GATA zinc finger domain-containing protein 16-like [Wyeomyia smithii]|uniref:GATA zinc finger domain-containing protein 16-like n=1 Tax=Wyeomyia smithii TaxID=174621 RepID=UPI002467B4D2|nr:GATA zinc finger domain-containing protein 16-like [Wyeomyia smithii]
MTFELKKLTEQQKLLVTQIDSNTQVVHKFTLQYPNQPNQTFTAMEDINNLETLLKNLKHELATINKNHSISGALSTLKNHLTSLVDLTSIKLREEIKNEISQLGKQSPHEDPNIKLNILDELKSLSTKFDTIQKKAQLSTSPVSQNDCDHSGWRLIGSTKRWKADWRFFDEKTKRREEQDRIRFRAWRNRQKRSRQRNRASRISNLPNRNHVYSNNNNNNNYHRGQNINFNTNSNRRYTNPNVNNSVLNNHNSPNYNMVNKQQNNGTNYHNDRQHTNSNRFHANQMLPPDRVLLAAAKDRFSRTQAYFIPTIQFQRGETLNPYPANDAFPLS